MQRRQRRAGGAKFVRCFSGLQRAIRIEPDHGVELATDRVQPLQRHRGRRDGGDVAGSDGIGQRAEIELGNRVRHHGLSVAASQC
jgi:hypothetical protein